MPTLRCVRCGREAEGVVDPPVAGAVGEELETKIFRDCWAEWERAEIMVINELRLNFMDPRSQEILLQHMREFLALDT